MQIQDLQQERIHLHRDIYMMAQELRVSLEILKNYEIAEGMRLFPVDPNSEDYAGDTDILGDFSFPLMTIEVMLYVHKTIHKTRYEYKTTMLYIFYFAIIIRITLFCNCNCVFKKFY